MRADAITGVGGRDCRACEAPLRRAGLAGTTVHCRVWASGDTDALGTTSGARRLQLVVRRGVLLVIRELLTTHCGPHWVLPVHYLASGEGRRSRRRVMKPDGQQYNGPPSAALVAAYTLQQRPIRLRVARTNLTSWRTFLLSARAPAFCWGLVPFGRVACSTRSSHDPDGEKS